MKQNYADELNRDDDIHAEIFELELPPLPTREPEIREVVPDGAIVPLERGWLYRQFELTPVGVQIDDDTTEEEWRDLGSALFKLDSAIQWLIGDWLGFGERKWKTTYEQVALEKGYEVKSLYQYVWVAKSVKVSMRIETLSFTHHSLVAGLPPKEQARWLQEAAAEQWTISQMRKAMKPKPTPLSPEDKAINEIFERAALMMEQIGEVKRNPEHRSSLRQLFAGMRAIIDGWEKELEG